MTPELCPFNFISYAKCQSKKSLFTQAFEIFLYHVPFGIYRFPPNSFWFPICRQISTFSLDRSLTCFHNIYVQNITHVIPLSKSFLSFDVNICECFLPRKKWYNSLFTSKPHNYPVCNIINPHVLPHGSTNLYKRQINK